MGIPITDYPMYEVNEDGTVFSKFSNKVLKTNVSGSGYHTVELFNNEGSKRFLVHRLVAMAFLPNPDLLPQVNHKDEDKSNNDVKNLEWCTAEYNMHYGVMGKIRHTLIDYSKPSYKENAIKNGKKASKAVKQFLNGRLVAEYESGKEASRETGVNHSHILETCRGKRKSAGGFTWQYKGGEDLSAFQF